MKKSQPKYFLVRALGPDGVPYGKAIGHVEDHVTEVPKSERFVALCYFADGDLPQVVKVGTSAAKAEAVRLVREAQHRWRPGRIIGYPLH